MNGHTVDLTDIIFNKKNREYGAYVLRKRYKRYLSWALWLAIVVFVLSVSSPLIYSYLKPKEEAPKRKKVMLDYTQLSEPPSIDKKAPPPDVVAPPPLKSTMKFLPPVVKPDAEVTEEYIPTVDELKLVDPGTKTQEGDPTGVDYSLMEIDEPVEEVVEEEARPEIFTYVEEMPSYPGGQEELMAFVTQNIVYPEIAKRAGVEGKVFVSFVIAKDGSISGVQVVKGIGAGCDEEAIRVIKQMPKWTPGKQNGVPVHVRVSIPIFFKLQN